jgi:hypothetical protein
LPIDRSQSADRDRHPHRHVCSFRERRTFLRVIFPQNVQPVKHFVTDLTLLLYSKPYSKTTFRPSSGSINIIFPSKKNKVNVDFVNDCNFERCFPPKWTAKQRFCDWRDRSFVAQSIPGTVSTVLGGYAKWALSDMDEIAVTLVRK